MLFNRLKFISVFAALLVAGLAFVAIPATAAVIPVLSVPDADEDTPNSIEVYGIRAESVTFELTITFQNDANPPVNTPVTGFDVDDIVLQALDNNDNNILNGATAAPPITTDNAVWTTTIRVDDNISKVNIAVPARSVQTPPDFSGGNFLPGTLAPDSAVTASVEIVRSAAPPLTLTADGSISGTTPFAVTLTSTQAITLTRADIKVTGGFIATNGISSDTARRVWTVTITPGVGVTEVTVEPSDNGAYIFSKGTYTVDTAGPVATITGTPPVGGGPFPITITFNEPLRTGTTLLTSEITVVGGLISVPFAIANTNSYVATLTPNPGVAVVTVQVSAGAVMDVGGVQNAATPATAKVFRVAATTGPGVTGLQLDVIFSEIANRNDNTNEWIEFKNTSASSQNVNGWIVSIVTAVNRDEFLFSLPNVTIPAGGVLLVTDKDPGDPRSTLAKEKNAPLWKQVNIGALPNAGNFILVLRKSNNRAHLGTVNYVVDAAGYFPNAAQVAALVGQSAPAAKNNLRASRVYWRQHEDIIGTSSKGTTDAAAAFQPIGFTGIGYGRATPSTNENGGTPGYPNDVRKGDVGDLSGDVTISEIMFATDGRPNEVQWIELYNSSKTEAVALDADNGWSLIIENYDDPNSTNEPLSGEINFKDSGDVKTILPNQTVLIVSSSRGRNSDRTHFPSSRVFGVYEEAGREFDMDSRNDPFLNPTVGFYIELVDGRNRTADEVGNLDLRARRSTEPAWELPMGRTEDGDRTSMIRRYRTYRNRRYADEGVVQDGTERGGWILAVNTAFLNFSRANTTWYGIDTDYGTPGLRRGQALPVQLSQFRPDLTETGTVVINWMTESEVDNAGFNILRSQTRTGEFKAINAQLIPGAGTTAERNTYTWTDTTAQPNVVYYYQIEDVSLGGERQTLATVRLRGLVSAKGKLTTQWGELKRSRD